MSVSGLRRAGLYSALTSIALVAFCVLAVAYVARNIRVKKITRGGRDEVSIQTPGGLLNIRTHENVDPEALGFAVYPNAKRWKDNKGASFEWTSSDGKADQAVAVVAGEYLTSDSARDVLAWYRTHLPNWVVVNDRPKTVLERNENGYRRFVTVYEKGDGTHIQVATMGEPASN
jgi:hypothetical protein